MKIYVPHDKGSALCWKDGRVSMTYLYRDLPLRDGSIVVKDVLVGVCDQCQEAIVIPAQSTPIIATALKRLNQTQ